MIDDKATFVDTNVLAYAHDGSESIKQPVAQALLEGLWQSGTGVLSTQVLQEFYVVVTRKFDPPMTLRAAREVVALYAQWAVVEVDVALILAASELEERHRLSFWDALIVEAARRAGATRLVSEDFQSGRSIVGVRLEDPFIEAV
ncbi:MAG: PIN domain-containing protein [Actinomycetota bacterium]